LVAPVQYGSSVESLIAYLHTRQYIPFNRMREYFLSLCQLSISEGTIQNILKRMAERALPVYNRIKETISEAKYLGGDETSVRINGQKGWFWTLQNEQYTFIHCTDNRGYATLETLFPKGLPQAIIGHDAYSAWFKLPAKGHQLCLAHLLRDINFFEEVYKSEWVTNLKTLFKDALQQKNKPIQPFQNFNSKLTKLLENPPDSNHTLLVPFVKRLLKYQESLFNFLDHEYVPADNNASERAIRNAKVKTKISGQFKSIENAQIFAILRSVVDTLNKNNQPILVSLQNLANFRPE
jgi:transposase